MEDRVLLRVLGPIRQKFLHGVLSNDVASLRPGQGCRAALMDARGHQLAWMRILVDRECVWLELTRDRLDLVERQLLHYRVAAPVRFERAETAVLAVVGERAADVLSGETGPSTLRTEEHGVFHVNGDDVVIARAGDLPARGFVVYTSPAALAGVESTLRNAGAQPLDVATLDALRIEEGRVWYGRDVSEQNLLHETGMVGEYHSATKGCYIGQEVVARLSARGGHVSKLMRGLRLAHPVTPGASLRAAGAIVGQVTTAGQSPRLGPIAMGYVHRAQAEPGTSLDVDGVEATVAALPLLEANRD